MRRGHNANWDINEAKMGRLRRGLQSMGLKITGDPMSIPIIDYQSGIDSIDPFTTSSGLSDLRSQALDLGVITTNQANLDVVPDGRSAKAEQIEGNIPLFEALWRRLGGNLTQVDQYRVPLENLPGSVALEMEARIKKLEWSELGGNTIKTPQDLARVINGGIDNGIDSFTANIVSTFRQVLGPDGFNKDFIDGHNMGAIWDSVSLSEG